MLHAPVCKMLAFATAISGTLLTTQAAAQNFEVTGQLQVQIELVEACFIDNEEPATGANDIDFGVVDFGQHTTFFGTAASTATGNPDGVLTIRCTPGVTPKLSFDGGENADEGAGVGLRAMKYGTHFVTYDLFNDSLAIPIGTPINLPSDGEDITFNINGVAYGEGGLIAGIYQDIVTVTLTL